LIESKKNLHRGSIVDSTHAIFFFGTPHQGFRTDGLEAVVDDDSGWNLIAQLKEGSEFLKNQKEDLFPIFERLKERKVISFYETMMTPTTRVVIRALPIIFTRRDSLFHLARIG
jgi:hypothetical protein